MEERVKTNLDKIEKLIIDGQKEVVKRLDNLENRFDNVENRLGNVDKKVDTLDKKVDTLDKKVDLVHKSLKKEIFNTARILDYDIKEIGKKLEEHLTHPV